MRWGVSEMITGICKILLKMLSKWKEYRGDGRIPDEMGGYQRSANVILLYHEIP
jgi:hypothetical protein